MKKVINSAKKMLEKANAVFLQLSVMLVFAVPGLAFAARKDETFSSLTELFLDYLKGSFGLAISLASVVIGAVAALMTQSLMFLAFGVGLAIGFMYVPDILEEFFSAVVM